MRLIDADALMQDIDETVVVTVRHDKPSAELRGANKIIDRINNAPTIDPASLRVKGEWAECDWVEYDGHGECIHYPEEALRCSNCCNAFKKELLWKSNFCPNCGADMRGNPHDS